MAVSYLNAGHVGNELVIQAGPSASQIVTFIIAIIIIFALLGSLTMVIVGIIQWILFRKESGKASKAKRRAVIGLIIFVGVILIFFLINIVFSALGLYNTDEHFIRPLK